MGVDDRWVLVAVEESARWEAGCGLVDTCCRLDTHL